MNPKQSIAALTLVALAATGAGAATFMPTIFSDHMVVQQKLPLKLFGKDEPGRKIIAEFADQKAEAVAQADGRWQLTIAPPAAGGPYTLSVHGSSTLTFADVLVGEVWLCSGQSNMEFALQGADNGPAERDAANDSRIRLFQIPQVRDESPRDQIPAKWSVCNSASAGGFSAVGYFFGRKLRQELKVPVGLINASWGGTMAEAWTPKPALLQLPGMEQLLKAKHEDQSAAWREHGEKLNQWMVKQGIPLDASAKQKAGWVKVDFDDSAWKTMQLPNNWQSQGLVHNGIVWFRKTLQISDDVKLDAPAILEIGAADDFDITFVNDRSVGHCDGQTPNFWMAQRHYEVPAGILRHGKNVIAVRVTDIGGAGGLVGPNTAMSLSVGGRSFPLAGPWQYQPEQWFENLDNASRPPIPGGGDTMATELYNAMIHPYAGYPIAGAIWYQGESNCGQPEQYKKLLPTMIQSWREAWGRQFPFFIVQIAGFEHNATEAGAQCMWATFRDAQRQIAQTVPHSGLAVAIDVGNPTDIHPTNKQAVGNRLAQQALAKVYGKDIAASGPVLDKATRRGSEVVIRFTDLAGGLSAKDNILAQDFELRDASGQWAWADAKIQGDHVVVSSPKITNPVMVRYAWRNTPPARLYNQAGLPAVPFSAEVK